MEAAKRAQRVSAEHEHCQMWGTGGGGWVEAAVIVVGKRRPLQKCYLPQSGPLQLILLENTSDICPYLRGSNDRKDGDTHPGWRGNHIPPARPASSFLGVQDDRAQATSWLPFLGSAKISTVSGPPRGRRQRATSPSVSARQKLERRGKLKIHLTD